ncbi:MAG: transcriptional repressor [Deltaproteobacteria bacterium]|nr:transcriptional repressor [Deltaproteobacteria bacterium]
MTNTSLEKRLRDKNLRPTKARIRILELFETPGINHLTCEDVVKTLLKKDSSIGQATLYQNVNLLADAGVLTRYTGPEGMLLHNAKSVHHHHIVCRQCGDIMDILIEGHCENLKPYALDEQDDISGWQVNNVVLEFYGTCPVCA